MLKVVGVKNPVLRLKAKPVGKIDKKVKKLIADMKETLMAQKDPEGVGLAAPQVGKSLQLFITRYKDFERVVINPEILSVSGIKHRSSNVKRKHDLLEGCLSLPHYYGPIKRDQKVKVKYLTLDTDHGSPVTKTEVFEGFPAQIIGHEIDHLNGVLFMDHILKQRAPLYKFDGKDWEEVELV